MTEIPLVVVPDFSVFCASFIGHLIHTYYYLVSSRVFHENHEIFQHWTRLDAEIWQTKRIKQSCQFDLKLRLNDPLADRGLQSSSTHRSKIFHPIETHFKS